MVHFEPSWEKLTEEEKARLVNHALSFIPPVAELRPEEPQMAEQMAIELYTHSLAILHKRGLLHT